MKPRVVVSWSTGKDSAWCLHRLRAEGEVEVVGLLTTVTPEFGRVSVHGTRLEMLRAQSRALGLPVREVPLPYPCSNEAYQAAMHTAIEGLGTDRDASHLAFGDLFLEDVRAYREELLAPTGLDPLFPLWGLDTGAVALEMLHAGLRAVVVSAPESSAAVELVGREWSMDAVVSLADEVDPCGERGEFHTCVVGGVGLDSIAHEVGEIVRRDGVVYADVLSEAC